MSPLNSFLEDQPLFQEVDRVRGYGPVLIGNHPDNGAAKEDTPSMIHQFAPKPIPGWAEALGAICFCYRSGRRPQAELVQEVNYIEVYGSGPLDVQHRAFGRYNFQREGLIDT